ncbi:hypothetical protein ACJZ2D_013928 [Fusarium nematophilum]
MPLDPLSALSVAAAVVQFVDFARTIVCKSKAIYEATSGMLQTDSESRSAAERLADLSKELQRPIVFTEFAEKELAAMPTAEQEEMRRRYGQVNDRLRNICRECDSLSQELLQKLSELEIPPHARFRKWKSFRRALKSVWTKDAIDATAGRLESLRRDLDTHVLAIVRESQAITFIAQDNRFQCLSKQTQALVEKLSKLQSAKEDQPNKIKRVEESETFKATEEVYHRKLAGFLDEYRDHYTLNREQNEIIIKNLATFKELYKQRASGAVVGFLQGPAERIEENILGSLRFPEIEHRFDEVPKEFDTTCRWIFKDPQSHQLRWESFVDWLEQGTEVYWIQGKAASGKSTIMKYLWNSTKTHECLDTWRGAAAIASAVFFFWSGGTAVQRTHVGLLRSLLYSVLKWRRELISEVFPEEWARKSNQLACHSPLTPEKWSLGRLRTAFEKLATLANEELKMCFFIDGLDEYEGEGAEIAGYIRIISCLSVHVKFCVSSRPWPVFRDIFHNIPTLKVQDFNRRDIEHFVQANLTESTHWKYLSAMSPTDAESVMREIVERADGVFLWVVLVVRSLIKGLRNGDLFFHLRQRLSQLPAELERLFDALLAQVDSQDRPESSKIFQIFRASRHQLDILTLQRALLYPSIQEVLEIPLNGRILEDEHDKQLEGMTLELDRFWDRVNSRTGGLLEAPSPTWKHRHFDWWETKNAMFVHYTPDKLIFQRICYLHRTVKDYLEQPSIWKHVLKQTTASFDPSAALLSSLVVEAKAVGLSLEAKHLCDVGLQLFQKAARLDVTPSDCNDRLMEHLDSVLTNCASVISTGMSVTCRHWPDLDPWSESRTTGARRWYVPEIRPYTPLCAGTITWLVHASTGELEFIK